MLAVKFVYDGLIGKNYGVDGVYNAVSGDIFQCENIKDEKIAAIWIKEGFAVSIEKAKPAPKIENPVEPVETPDRIDAPKLKKRGRKPKGE